MINIDFSIARRLPKDKQERRACLPIISQIMYWAKTARFEGRQKLESLELD